MASRRVMMLTNNEYIQPLKLSFNNKKVITPNAAYNSIITKISFERPQNKEYRVKAWLRFNSNTFNGVQMVGSLFRGKTAKTIASCTFKIYSIDVTDNWTETLLVTTSGTAVNQNKFTASSPESALAPAFLTGELTYKMEVEITRFSKTYSDIFYFNHLGIYDSFIRLKNDVEFLDITKKDL
jgi:hypothetical protein